MIIKVKYIRIILSPNWLHLVVFESFKEVLMHDLLTLKFGIDVAIFRALNVPEHGISLQDFNIKSFKALAIPLI